MLLHDGRIMNCGNNRHGQLGHGDNTNRTAFEEVKQVPRNIFKIICGGEYVFLLLSDGIVMGCGHNKHGQLVHGDTQNRTVFEKSKRITTKYIRNCLWRI